MPLPQRRIPRFATPQILGVFAAHIATALSGCSTPDVGPRIINASTSMSSETRACVARDYPLAARRAVATGTTTLEVTVEPSGKVRVANVVQSAGSTPEHKLLDALALEVVQCPGVYQASSDGLTHQRSYVWKLQ
jgi:periplasmic protein TonB